jgi:hypothetical protein
MDLFNETRSLVYLGPVLRRGRGDMAGFTVAWSELVAALLDNYCKPLQASGSVFCYSLLSFCLAVILICEKRIVAVRRMWVREASNSPGLSFHRISRLGPI